MSERNWPRPWWADLLDLTAARVDSLASGLAARAIADVDDTEIAAYVALADRVLRDLERLQIELGDGEPPVLTRSRPAWMNAA